MSCHQLGQNAQAMSELAEARRLVENRFAKPLQPGYELSGSWCAWVIARHLEIEAGEWLQRDGDPEEKE